MKIYDCFTFFNELDLLEFRFRLLDECVDYFVIAESNLTHAGHAKEYLYEIHKERFTKWHHKIIYLPITQTTEGLFFNQKETSYNSENGKLLELEEPLYKDMKVTMMQMEKFLKK